MLNSQPHCECVPFWVGDPLVFQFYVARTMLPCPVHPDGNKEHPGTPEEWSRKYRKCRLKRSDISDEEVLLAYCVVHRARKLGVGQGKLGVGQGQSAEYILAQRFPRAHPKVVWRAMERSYDRGLVEFGTNLRWGWLTPEGDAYLRDRGLQPSGPYSDQTGDFRDMSPARRNGAVAR